MRPWFGDVQRTIAQGQEQVHRVGAWPGRRGLAGRVVGRHRRRDGRQIGWRSQGGHVAHQSMQHQHIAVGGQVERFQVGAAQQQALQLGHGTHGLRPRTLQPQHHVRVIFQLAAACQVARPVRRLGIEPLVEALSGALVGVLVALLAVNLQQLEVRQRTRAAGATHMAQQQIDRRLRLAECQEKIGLLVQVQQFLNRHRPLRHAGARGEITGGQAQFAAGEGCLHQARLGERELARCTGWPSPHRAQQEALGFTRRSIVLGNTGRCGGQGRLHSVGMGR